MAVTPFASDDAHNVASATRTRRSGLLGRLKHRWNAASLAVQFLLAGGLVSIVAMFLIGAVVATLIEKTVTRNAASTTALFVDSVIAPLLPDMQTNRVLEDVEKRALDETLDQGALGGRLAAMRLWARDGTILYADEDELIGRKFMLTPQLEQAFSGTLVADFERMTMLPGRSGTPLHPLLEIYNPVLQPWSGDVVAVIQFYEVANEFEASLRDARLRSWLAVAAVTAAFFLTLGTIVVRGSRIIDRQGVELKAKLRDLTALLEQNRSLRLRAQRAAQRVTTLNERYLRRLGADLHDGPAQLVALASLRLDSETVLAPDTPPLQRQREVVSIRSSLDEALGEIRSICHGLVLPQIEKAGITEVATRAIDSYEGTTGAIVERRLDEIAATAPLSQRICVYRFLQEALNNGYRHCRGARQIATLKRENGQLSVSVSDDGPGFDPAKIRPGSIGIAGIRERVESLGGSFQLETAETGTTLVMTLDMEDATSQ